MAAEGVVRARTEILVTRGSAYSYAFLEGGDWRACSDCKKHYTVQGATYVDFISAYRGLKRDKLGPGKIANAIYSLSSSTRSGWRYSFHIICFAFIESMCLIEFGCFIRQILVDGAEMEDIYTHVVELPSNIKAQPNYWGQAYLSAAAAHVDEHQRIRAKIWAEVNFCQINSACSYAWLII